MQYNTLGNTGLVISRLAFGAMTFGKSEGMFKDVSKVDQKLANTLVGKSIDAGINFFNTADVYTEGQSEEMLGKALGKRRQDVVIATKAAGRTGEALVHQGLSQHHLMESAEASLRRLNTDYIDVYLVHRVDPHTPLEETLEALNDLVRQGKVRYVGLSNWPAWKTAKAVGIQERRGWARFRAAEMYYSLLGRDLEHEFVPMAEDAGIGLMIWSPLAGGFLSGKYTRKNPQGGGGRLKNFNFLPMDKEKGYDLVEAMREMGATRKATPAQVALAWLLSKPYVSSILVGANRLDQLQDNLKCFEVGLSAKELKKLDEMTGPPALYPNWFSEMVRDQPVEKALGAAGSQ